MGLSLLTAKNVGGAEYSTDAAGSHLSGRWGGRGERTCCYYKYIISHYTSNSRF